MCCCIEGNLIGLGDARGLASDGMPVREAGGEGKWISLGGSFFRDRCKGFMTLAGLGLEA